MTTRDPAARARLARVASKEPKDVLSISDDCQFMTYWCKTLSTIACGHSHHRDRSAIVWLEGRNAHPVQPEPVMAA